MKYIAAIVLVFAAFAAHAQNSVFIGYKYIPGDTAWFQTHLVSRTSIGVTGGSTTNTNMEQTVSHHQYAVSHTDSATTLVIIYDSIALKFGGDSTVINYNSTNPADSTASFNMMVFPLRALIGHAITAYVNGHGVVDSVDGVDKAVADASLLLNRSAQIQALKDALNDAMMKDLLNQQLANLPNNSMTVGVSTKINRARMVGMTQFKDELVTSLEKVSADTAWLTRTTYTQVASPTIQYGDRKCVIDSTWGVGTQVIMYNLPHGAILSSHEEFNNYLRAGIAGTNSSVIQTNSLTADVRQINYVSRGSKKGAGKKK